MRALRGIFFYLGTMHLNQLEINRLRPYLSFVGGDACPEDTENV